MDNPVSESHILFFQHKSIYVTVPHISYAIELFLNRVDRKLCKPIAVFVNRLSCMYIDGCVTRSNIR